MGSTPEIEQLRKEIQDLKKSQDEESQYWKILTELLNNARQGIWEWDRKSNLLSFDNSQEYWVTYLGYQMGEVDHTLKWWFRNMHHESRQKHAEAMDDYLTGKKDYFELEHRLKTKSGKWAWFWTRGIATALDKSGAATHMTGIYRNITSEKEAELKLHKANVELEQRVEERTRQLTEINKDLQDEIAQRKRVEEKLHWARRHAESANQAKTEFLANISHELRTPLHHILNYSKFGVEKTDKTKEQRVRYFSQIRKSGQRLQILVNDLLDVSSLELGKVDYRFESTNIQLLVSEAISEMEPMVREKDITLAIVDPPMATELKCDERRIEQVIYNLLSNAIRYSPANGKVTVSFDSAQLNIASSAEPALKISITDQGIGIPETELDTIFDAFVQSTRTSTGAGGTGLGLSICKRIVHDHHGRIWAVNSINGGAVISFLLPYEQKSAWRD